MKKIEAWEDVTGGIYRSKKEALDSSRMKRVEQATQDFHNKKHPPHLHRSYLGMTKAELKARIVAANQYVKDLVAIQDELDIDEIAE